MRSRISLFALVCTIGSFAIPYAAHAAFGTTFPFFGPIIPDSYNVCPAGWALVIVVINRIISLLITLAVVFVAPLMIAYAGFLLVVDSVSPGGIQKAKSILQNTIIGIVVALAAWVIVDALMAVLYNRNLGAWDSIITWGDQTCLPQLGALPTDGLNQSLTGLNSDSSIAAIAGQLAQCSSSNTVCSPSALQQAGFTAQQANIMSCIAVTESSGIANTPPYNTTHPGSPSTACGLFQITRTTWGTSASGACSDFSNCTSASCNTQAALTLVRSHGYTDWTCAGCNNKAAACVQQFGG